MAKVSVSKIARDDLIYICKYIREEFQSTETANKVLCDLRTAIESLQTMPERGAPLDSVLSVHTEYRFLICGNYRIFYLSDGKNVEVIRILHMMQDYMRVLFGKKM